MSATDEFVMDRSKEPSTSSPSDFSSRYVVEMPDSNGGSYPSSQINFSLSGLTTHDGFLSMAESYVSFPYVVNMSSTTALGGTQFACALKAGFQNLVAGVTFGIDNTNILNVTELTNIPINWKIISQSSQDDRANLADSLNFAMDNVYSMGYTETQGEFNNKILPTAFDGTAGYEGGQSNDGLLTRMAKTSYTIGEAQKIKFSSLANCVSKRKSHVVTSALSTTYHIMVTIPLRFLSDFFEKAPLAKGVFPRLTLAIHSGKSTYSIGAGAGGAITALTSSAMFNNFPVITTQKQNVFVSNAAASNITISCGIGKAGGVDNAFGMTSAYFNAVIYKMRPDMEAKYMLLNHDRRIDYTAIATNRQSNVAPNGNLGLQINSSISRPRGLLIYTQLSSVVNGSTNAADPVLVGAGNVAISPMMSPFSSAPLTCMKEASLTDFQVLIGGQPLWEYGARTYTYDMFMNEIRSGGIQLGSSSGLLDQRRWEEGYGYIYVDLSRKKNPIDDVLSKAIEVRGRNNSICSVDYHCFVFYEESIILNVITGKVKPI